MWPHGEHKGLHERAIIYHGEGRPQNGCEGGETFCGPDCVKSPIRQGGKNAAGHFSALAASSEAPQRRVASPR